MLRYSRGIAVLISLSILCLSGCAGSAANCGDEKVVSLNGAWRFTADKKNEGMDAKWFEQKYDHSGWQQVEVPHTWQVMDGLEGYTGNAWYARTIKLDCPVQDKVLKLEFDAVNRDASVWVNGKLIGEHNGSGFTPFSFIVPPEYAASGTIEIVVRVTNSFSRKALPYDSSFDWTPDGGIIRNARLRILPRAHIERLLVDAEPSSDFKQAKITARVIACAAAEGLSIKGTLFDPSNNIVADISAPVKINNDGNLVAELSCIVGNPDLWHFDKPDLYHLVCRLMNNNVIIHETSANFGIRKIEVKDGF